MALTRDFLQGLGLSKDVEDKIIDAYKGTAAALSQANADLEALRTENAKLKPTAAAAAAEKARADKLDSEFNAFKASVNEQEKLRKTSTAYRSLAKAANIDEKRLDIVVKAAEVTGKLAKLTLKDDGTLDGADKLTEDIKTEWADFVNTENVKGSGPATPPAKADEDTQLAAFRDALGLPKQGG